MEATKLTTIEEAALGGGVCSAEGVGDGVFSTDPSVGAGDGGGGGEVVEERLVLSAITTTSNFSFLRQLSLSPLMK